MGIYLLYIISVVLIHSVHGEGVIFSVTENPITKTVGQSWSVVCSVDVDTPDYGNAVLQWYDNNNDKVSSQYSDEIPYIMDKFPTSTGTIGVLMMITKLDKDSAGSYKCEAKINDQEYSKTLQLKIAESLTFTNCKPKQFGILDETSIIECTAKSGKNTVYTVWGPNLDLDNNENLRSTDISLTILKTTMADAGQYVYSAFTGRITEHQYILFSVYTYPVIEQPLLQTTAVVGREVTLYCKANGLPDPMIEWTREGTTNVLQTTDRIIVTQSKEGDGIQGSLKIKSVIKEDEKEYKCTAKNLATENNPVDPPETTMMLTVQIPPKLEHMDDRKGTEGGPASLVCVARGNPIPNIIWENVHTGERYSSGSSDQRISVTAKDLEDAGNLGSQLTLSFTKLTHSDAGEYRCEAKNNADTAEASVNLEVLYRPNFLSQGKTNFYTWEGQSHTHSFIECVANANTAPAFKWYRGGSEIIPGEAFHRIGTTEITTDNDQQATSKLYVTFNGNNDEAVFGKYMCEAFNPTGQNNITLSMEKAGYPADPAVTVQDEDARHILFWIFKPQVDGPDVTQFKVVYKVKGSMNTTTQLVGKNNRDHDDETRTYTELSVTDLLPNTNYIFTFYTINPVGQSTGKEIARTTQQISVPKVPVIQSQIQVVYSDRVVVKWKAPSDGGATILEYKLTYQLITVKQNSTSDPSRGYERLSAEDTVVVVERLKDRSYTIEKLMPGKYYQVKVYALNSKGYSVPGEMIFATKEGAMPRPNTSGAPKMVPVSVSVTVFGCLAALSACLKCFV